MTVIRIGICLLVTFAVLAHGAVEPWSEAGLEVGAAALLLVWALRAATDAEFKIVWNPLLWPLLGLWLVAALQLATGRTASPFATRVELNSRNPCHPRRLQRRRLVAAPRRAANARVSLFPPRFA